jgi:carbamate kinase
MSRIIIALGGNALGNTPDQQVAAVRQAVQSIAPLLVPENQVVICHGNGPQVGMINLAFEDGAIAGETPRMPLAECTAMSQGYIGFHLQNALTEIAQVSAATVLTRCLVDRADPGFTNPTKPIGSFYTAAQAEEFAQATGYVFREDSGRGWRRVVASPAPLKILEIDTIKSLLSAGAVVIAGGGGGIPVIESPVPGAEKSAVDKSPTSESSTTDSSVPSAAESCTTGSTTSVPFTSAPSTSVSPTPESPTADATQSVDSAETTRYVRADAVIDKDFCSELIAEKISADYLFILTAVEKVAINFGKPNQQWLGQVSAAELESYMEAGHFAVGSMLPKVQAALKFVNSGLGNAVITSLEAAPLALSGQAGTLISK